MTPMMLQPGDGEGGGESSGMRRMPIDKPQTPPGFYAPPPSDVDLGEEDFEVATNTERITELKEKTQELAELGHRLEVGQEKAEGMRAVQTEQIAALAKEIPIIKEIQVQQGKKVDECASGVGQILAILQGAGMVAPPAAGAGTAPSTGPIAVNNPTAQLVHFLMPAIRQLPPQIILLLVAYLIFTGKITG